jgi:PAS domain S-box-containing protein
MSMDEVERRRRPRIAWIDRSLRSKALVVLVAPTFVLGLAAAATAWFATSAALRALDAAALVVAIGSGLVLWHFFTTGVVTRLRRLEHEADRLEGAGPLGEPHGRDEIGRLSARLEEAAAQVRAHAAERDRARHELTEIVTASPVVSLRYDVGRRAFSYASPNIDRLLGMSAEQVMADPHAVIARFHPDDEQTLRAAFVAGHGVGDDRVSMVLRVRSSVDDESWREVEASYALEVDERGRPRTVSAYLIDVSERHAAQRAADDRRFMVESIFHASPDTIVVRDTAGRVVMASSSLGEFAEVDRQDVAPEEMIEAAFRQGRLHREDRLALERLIERCMAGEQNLEPVVTTGRPRRGRRSIRTFETRARPILDAQRRVTGTVTVSRDITERVELERSLRRATVAAERASEAKSQFLSRMSHELRTPLNAILGFAQLLELDELSPDQASSVDQIQRAGGHLLSLINEVLDIARIEAGQLTVTTEPVHVGEVLEEVTALLVPMAEAAAVHMMTEPEGPADVHVRADRQRLLQVLLNLGSNAVKYNEPGGTVAFRTSLNPDGTVRVSVHDTGPGITPEQQDLLFVPFARLGAEHSTVEGTGVGLALSKQLVEVMGGSIGVESVPGHGSTFFVDLQAADAAEVTRRDRAPAMPLPAPADDGATLPGLSGARLEQAVELATRKATGGGGDGSTTGGCFDDGSARPGLLVLHVEDNPSNASLVAQVLARRPQIRLLSAGEARLGLELARRHHPDLLLLDLHLPDLPGDEMLSRIKADPELADIKVVVVSADATPGRIRRLLDLGVEGYLTKPVAVEALLQVVDDQCARRAPAGS